MSDRKTSARYPGVFSYVTRAGRMWGVRVEADRDWQTGKRVQMCERGFRTQDAARQWQIAFQERRRRGDLLAPVMTPTGTYLADWLTARTGIAESSRLSYRNRIAMLEPQIGAVPLSRLSPRDIETAYAALLASGRVANTISGTHRVLAMALKDAVRLRLISRNPMDGVKAPSALAKPRTVLTVAHMRSLLDDTAQMEPWGLVWRVLAETWMRVGELVDLRWNAVDCARREIRVERSTRRTDHGTVSAGGKTPAARRTLPISADLAAWLQRYGDAARFRSGWSDLALVFCTAIGTPLSASQVGRALAADCKRLGLPVITPHGMRHSGASHAHDAGVSPKTLSMRLGHTDVATTLRVYSHPSADEHRKLSDRISELYG